MSGVLSVNLTDDWLDLNTDTGIAVGVAMNLQNLGNYHILIQESATEPSTQTEGFRLTTLGADYAAPKVLSGSLRVWVRCVSPQGSVLGVQQA
jgi:hypothetical protein